MHCSFKTTIVIFNLRTCIIETESTYRVVQCIDLYIQVSHKETVLWLLNCVLTSMAESWP